MDRSENNFLSQFAYQTREFGWMEQAKCQGEPPEIFFDCQSPIQVAKAKSICDKCPVKRECLKFCYQSEKACAWTYGVYGGMAPRERRDLFRKLRREERSGGILDWEKICP